MTHKLLRRAFLTTLGVQVSVPLCTRSARAADSYTLRVNMPSTPESLAGISILRFAAALNRRSNGQLKMEVYPNSQLANEATAIQDLPNAAVVDMSCQSSALLGTVVPQLQILDVPFIFRDANAGLRILDGPVLRPVLDQLEAKGVTIVGWGFNGFKEFQTLSKAVNVPDDMKGLRVRIQNSIGAVATYKALGAVPVVIDISELYAAMSQHTVDALDASMDSFVTNKFYNLAKYCAMLNHVFSVMPVLASKKKMDSLPKNLQTMIREEGSSLSQFWKGESNRRINEDIEISKKNGVTFTYPAIAPFRKAAEPAWAVFQQRIGGNLIEQVSRS